MSMITIEKSISIPIKYYCESLPLLSEARHVMMYSIVRGERCKCSKDWPVNVVSKVVMLSRLVAHYPGASGGARGPRPGP